MTRSELIQQLLLQNPRLTLKDVDMTVKVILDGISQSMERQGRVEIRGFGSFKINHRPPRIGRNPKTGVLVKVPAKLVPHFKAGKELCERVDKPKDI